MSELAHTRWSFSPTSTQRGSISHVLQRKCACGQHTIGSGECEACRKKKEVSSASSSSLQRAAVNRERVGEVPPIVYDVLRSRGQPLDLATRAFFEPRFAQDFSRVWVRAATARPSLSPQFLPAAPRPDAPLTVPGPAAKPGVAELYITVRRPAKITDKDVLATSPLDAPSAGISFQLARHAKFKQDEYVHGHLQWNPVGKSLPPSEQEEEFAAFTHSWTSETVDRPDLPGNPILLKDFDTHTWGLAVVPGSDCEEAAKKYRPPFDRLKNDWTFRELGKFVDAVTFPDRETKRVYFFDYSCTKVGKTITADISYANVDKVETF